MKGKAMACILATSMLVILAGCSNGEPAVEVETSSATTTSRPASTPRVTAATDTSAALSDTGGGPTVSEDDAATSMEVTSFRSEVDGITFDMTPEEVLQALEDKGMELKPVDYNMMPDGVENPVKDGRQYNGTDFSFYYSTTDGVMVTFSPDGDEMWFIDVSTPSIATEEGLRMGDSVQKMESLYGTGYWKDVEDFPVYQYYNGTHYLTFFYEDNIVKNWAISMRGGVNRD